MDLNFLPLKPLHHPVNIMKGVVLFLKKRSNYYSVIKGMSQEKKRGISDFLKEVQDLRNTIDIQKISEKGVSKRVFKYLSHLEFLDSRLPFNSAKGNHVKVNFRWRDDLNPNITE